MSWQHQNYAGAPNMYGQQGQPRPAYAPGGGYYQQAPSQMGAPPQYGAPPPHMGAAPPHMGVPPQYGAPPQYGQPGGYYHAGAPPAQMPPPGMDPTLWQWFQTVDADRSGQITAVELKQALMNGNWSHFNDEVCRLMIGMFDRDGNGTINAVEFGALWKYIQDWKNCFERFDTDRSGTIDANELSMAFTTFGYRLSNQFCQLCIRIFDRREARTIKFDDFIQCCVMLKSLTDKFRAKDVNQSGNINISYEQFLDMVLNNTLV